MVTGKVLAGYQWSGDAVYTMNQAELDGDMQLNFSSTYKSVLIFILTAGSMLKSGINGK